MGKMRKIGLLGIVVLVIFSLVACGGSTGNQTAGGSGGNEQGGSQPQIFSGAFATGSAGGVFNILGAGMAKVVNENSDYIRLNATTPSSTSVVPPMLHNGEAVVGIGQIDMFQRAMAGTGEYDQPYQNIKIVMGLYDNVMSAFVLENSPITNINQIEGLTVGAPSKTTGDILEAIFAEAGVSVNLSYLSYAEQAEAIKDGNIDVAIFTAFPKNGQVEELASTRGIRFLEVDDDVVKRWNANNPLLQFSTIPAGVYPGVDYEARFYTVFAVLAANADAPEEVIYDITKIILENHDSVRAAHPAGEFVTPEKTLEYIEKGIIDPNDFHPGARKYFEEIGILQ